MDVKDIYLPTRVAHFLNIDIMGVIKIKIRKEKFLFE